jgi:hypothetical protein
MIIDRTREATIQPLIVRPKDAWKILQCGNTRGYELVKAGELESFLDGRSRKITVDSIRAYIGRRLAASKEPIKEAGSRRSGQVAATNMAPK